MAQTIILLCLAALFWGATRASVDRHEITRGQPGFNSVASAAGAEYRPNLAGGGRAGGEAGRMDGSVSAGSFDFSRRRMPHNFRDGRRAGGGLDPRGREEMSRHRHRFGGVRNQPVQTLEEMMRQTQGRAWNHRATEGNAARIPHHQRANSLPNNFTHHRQMWPRGQGFRGQGQNGFPDLGRFDAGPQNPEGRMDMSRGNVGMGPNLNWFPGSHRYPGNKFPGHGRQMEGHRGHHGMRTMGHSAAGPLMGGDHRRGFGMEKRFVLP